MKYIRYFLCIITLLILMGLIFIYSASSIHAVEQCGNSYYFLKRQLIGILIGLCGCVTLSMMPTRLIRSLSYFFFMGSMCLVLLSFTKKFGLRINGASRWIHLGAVCLQPSELLKISWLLLIADTIERYERNFVTQRWIFLILFGLTSFCGFVLLKQPDFGNAVLLISVGMMLFFLAQLPLRRMIALGSGIIPILLLLIAYKPYRLRRIITFLNPWQDPQGAGFQIIQSLIAIGVGGWTGLGIGHSQQKLFYLPMPYTDFIFSIIVEEIGCMGGITIIGLYLLLLICGIGYAKNQKSTYAQLICIGTPLFINLQALFHIGVTMGLLPTKGIGLPFMSYGSSSLVGLLFMIGLMLNIHFNQSFK